MTGVITKGKPTAGHGEWLRSRGYQVMEATEAFIIQVSEFLPEVDLRGEGWEVAVRLLQMVEAKQAFTYRSQAILPSGKVVRGLALCHALERVGKGASALVMSLV